MRPLSTSRPISGIFSSEALNSESSHPASGAAPLAHGPGRKCILLLGKIPETMRRRAMESKASSFVECNAKARSCLL